MPKYHSTLPVPYGSAQDTRAGNITQTHDNTDIPEVETTSDYNEGVAAVFIPTEFSSITPNKQLFQFVVPVSIDSSVALPFKAQSIRIDNLTNQWLFIPSLRVYIPPDWFGTILTANGMQQATIQFSAPSGLVQPAPTVNTIVNVVAHFERVPDVAGTRRL